MDPKTVKIASSVSLLVLLMALIAFFIKRAND